MDKKLTLRHRGSQPTRRYWKVWRWRIFAAIGVAAGICLNEEAVSRPAVTPAKGTVQRAAIMDAIREGMGSNSIFVVDHLKVVTAPGAKLAFAEVHPASGLSNAPFRGWVLVTQSSGEDWHALWGVSYDGYDRCGFLRMAYNSAIKAADNIDGDLALFSSEFLRGRLAINTRQPDSICKGEVITTSNN